jgi:hypothetical protein
MFVLMLIKDISLNLSFMFFVQVKAPHKQLALSASFAGLRQHYVVSFFLFNCLKNFLLLHACTVAWVRRLMHGCNAKNNKLRFFCVVGIVFLRCAAVLAIYT